MSAPQGSRPVLSTANRRGKHLQDKQSAHYLLRALTLQTARHMSTESSLQLHMRSFLPKRQGNIWLKNAAARFSSHYNPAGKYLNFYGHSIFFMLSLSELFFGFQNSRYHVLEGNYFWVFTKKQKVHHH